MDKIIKKLSLIIISLLMIFSNISDVNAASASISVNSSSSKVVIGNTFTVTYTISSSSALGSWEFTPSYDSSKFKLISGDAYVADYASSNSTKSRSYTYKFKAIGTGSGKISVKSYAAYGYDESKMSLSAGSKTINVITVSEQKVTYSKNNDLKSLSIDGLKLSPAFNKNTTKYTADASSNTTKININASLDDSKARVSGTGTKEVEEGENKFNIVVTAQNGDTKTYTITVNVTDPNPIEITINDEKYVVVKREKNLKEVEGFTKSTTKIKDQDIPCLFNEKNDFTLVGLKNTKGDIELYLYNKKDDSYHKYESAKLSTVNIFPLTFEETYKPEIKRETIKIDNVSFDAIKLNNKGIYIIKAKNLDTAKDEYYEYDSKTNTLIRYIDEKTPEEIKNEQQLDKYKKILIVLSVESIIIILILICILISNMKKNKRRRLRIEEEKRKQELLAKEKELLERQKEEVLKEEKSTKKKRTVKKKEVSKNEKKKNN